MVKHIYTVLFYSYVLMCAQICFTPQLIPLLTKLFHHDMLFLTKSLSYVMMLNNSLFVSNEKGES